MLFGLNVIKSRTIQHIPPSYICSRWYISLQWTTRQQVKHWETTSIICSKCKESTTFKLSLMSTIQNSRQEGKSMTTICLLVDGLCSKQRLYLFKYAHDWHTNYFDGKLSANFDYIKPRRRLEAKFNYLVYQGTCWAISPKQEQIVFLTMQLKRNHKKCSTSLKWCRLSQCV